MKRENKILLTSGLTTFAAFITMFCLFSVNGFSLQTVIALAAAAFFAHLTSCFFKVENILRKQRRNEIRKLRQEQARGQLTVVRSTVRKAA